MWESFSADCFQTNMYLEEPNMAMSPCTDSEDSLGSFLPQLLDDPPIPRFEPITMVRTGTSTLPDIGRFVAGTGLFATADMGADTVVTVPDALLINHQWGKSANIVLRDGRFVTTRAVPAGAEIFWDYGVDYWIKEFFPAIVIDTYLTRIRMQQLCQIYLPNQLNDLSPVQRLVHMAFYATTVINT